MASLPSRLTSRNSYRIIRQHVKENINGKYAEITSDFNFCFTVKKNLSLPIPIANKREILTARGRSYRKKRYRENLIKERQIEVFEMTWSPENYSGYTAIEGFFGKDHQDLKQNIDNYLEGLIARINEPLKDCPHCEGLGVIECT